MKTNHKTPVLIIQLGLPICACCGLLWGIATGCGLGEFKQQENRLKPLTENHATTNELIKLLGTNFVMYVKGDTNWSALTNVLAREPASRLSAVRVGVSNWPTVVLFSTPTMMTWVFLDEEYKVVDFVVGAQ